MSPGGPEAARACVKESLPAVALRRIVLSAAAGSIQGPHRLEQRCAPTAADYRDFPPEPLPLL